MPHSSIDLLIIDDNPEDRVMVRELLSPTHRDYSIRDARTAAEGVRQFETQKPDCILLDYSLPDADGLTCLKHFRAGNQELSCAVILLTGITDSEITEQALQAGVQDFLPKADLTSVLLERAIDHAMVRCKLIHEREKALQELQHSERLLRLAQEAAGIGTFSWNLQTNETGFGGAYFDLYGFQTHQDVVDFKAWLDRIHPEDRERIRTETERVIAAGGPFNYEYRVIWPDNSVHWQLGRGAVLLDDDGVPVKLTGVNIDVTASKVLQEALMNANDELRHFAYAAGHDLQAPLRNVSIFAELLERLLGSRIDDETRQALTFIRSSSERMHTLVRDLLTYAQSGGAPGAPLQTVSLHTAVRRAMENLDSDVRNASARITWEDLPQVDALGDEMTQLFQNLIGNAIKYARHGVPPAIHIGARQHHGNWVISVRDNGQGFEMRDASVVFQPFRRLTSSETAGSGLGLAISRRIVERLGGRIWAESTPGEGSTFSFTLPVVAAAREQVPQTTMQASS